MATLSDMAEVLEITLIISSFLKLMLALLFFRTGMFIKAALNNLIIAFLWRFTSSIFVQRQTVCFNYTGVFRSYLYQCITTEQYQFPSRVKPD